MTEQNYAFIKNGIVTTIAVFDNPGQDLLDHFCKIHNVGMIIPVSKYACSGGTFDGEKFWLPQPYPSWIKNEETNDWEAPILQPAFTPENPKFYEWNEEILNWEEIQVSE